MSFREVFGFIKAQAGLSDCEMYAIYNMGQDYAIFLPEKDVDRVQGIVKRNGFECIDAGYIEDGERNVFLKQKDIILKGELLRLKL